MLETIERMAAVTKLQLSAQPNAGRPRDVEGRNIYLCSPEYMASYARRFILHNVRMVGGCCGTTPEHIRQIKTAVRSLARSAAGLRRHAGRGAVKSPRQTRAAGSAGPTIRESAGPARGEIAVCPARWRAGASSSPSRSSRRAAWSTTTAIATGARAEEPRRGRDQHFRRTPDRARGSAACRWRC